MPAIDVGDAAIDRIGNIAFSNETGIFLGNPANASGIITQIQVFADEILVTCWAGLFFLVSGTTYQNRSIASLGNVAKGSVQTFSGLTLAVQVGDYIGFWVNTGSSLISATTPAGGGTHGFVYAVGEHKDPGDQAEYTPIANYDTSVYGSGASVARGWWSK